MNDYGNATVAWNESEIAVRESLIREIPLILHEVWRGLNKKIQMIRVETPCIERAEYFASHQREGFPLIEVSGPNLDGAILRPETTQGTKAAFWAMYPMQNQRISVLPICLWQAGKSFRDEGNSGSMGAAKLRLREFYQMEFQLFAPAESKAPYIHDALAALCSRYGGDPVEVPSDELPHYSKETVDWEIDGVEIASCSSRVDTLEGELYEVAIGLDRLVKHIVTPGKGNR